MRVVRADSRITDAAYTEAGQLLSYCMLGQEQFVASKGVSEAEDVERRLDTAISAGTGLDAKLILLALHACVIVPEVVDRFDVETG